MMRIYKTLLRLYPADYNSQFAAEMLAAFQKAAVENRKRGRAIFVRFAIAEFTGLAAGAASEWIAKLTTDKSVRGRRLPDLRMMRPVGVPRELWFAAAGADLRRRPAPDDVSQLQTRVALLVSRMTEAIARRDHERARALSYQERMKRQNLRLLRQKPAREE